MEMKSLKDSINNQKKKKNIILKVDQSKLHQVHMVALQVVHLVKLQLAQMVLKCLEMIIDNFRINTIMILTKRKIGLNICIILSKK